ncbi:DNA repair protein [Stutzerimonas nitrititolerans]|uniref:DNA repair protein n=1 Tax=Stutzerimonas nitrititolerans TaxID=2482751 RepID=UPI0035E3E6E2
MNRRSRPFYFPCLALTLGIFAAANASAESMEERLRAQLRSTTQQLQGLQSEQAQASAARLAAENQLAIARAQIDKLTAELSRNKAKADTLTEQKLELQERASAYAVQSTELLDKHKQAYQELLVMARAKEAERVTLEAGLNERDAQLQQCTLKNQQMYSVAKDILDAYERMGVGDVVQIRQPFASQARVKFEELAQTYGDELYETTFDAAMKTPIQ